MCVCVCVCVLHGGICDLGFFFTHSSDRLFLINTLSMEPRVIAITM